VSDERTAPLRVLLACEWFVKYTAGLGGGLVENGGEVTLLTRDHGLEFGGDSDEMRRFVAATIPGGRHLTVDGRVRDVRELRAVGRLRRGIAAWRPDVVHIQDSLPHDMRLAVAAGLPRRYAITVHDVAPHPGGVQPGPRIRVLRRWLRERASLIFIHSEALLEGLARQGIDASRVVVVPHGIETLDPLPLPPDPEILFFGRIAPYKGVDLLLEAMPFVWAAQPEATLTIAGDGKVPDSPALADPRVRIENGHIPEAAIRALFARASCVALPYREASQSGVGSLARRYGRPIVATAVGGLPDLAAAGGGLVVPAGDAKELAAALVEVIGDRRRAEEMSRASIEESREALWPAVAARTIEAYQAFLL
jgi:glycosyltransferase involved in cell wall biosynthesis